MAGSCKAGHRTQAPSPAPLIRPAHKTRSTWHAGQDSRPSTQTLGPQSGSRSATQWAMQLRQRPSAASTRPQVGTQQTYASMQRTIVATAERRCYSDGWLTLAGGLAPALCTTSPQDAQGHCRALQGGRSHRCAAQGTARKAKVGTRIGQRCTQSPVRVAVPRRCCCCTVRAGARPRSLKTKTADLRLRRAPLALRGLSSGTYAILKQRQHPYLSSLLVIPVLYAYCV